MSEQQPPSAATLTGLAILETFIREADARPPHCAVDSLLTIAERLERDQGGRLTEAQVRTFAAFLLGAQRLAADDADPDVVPEWLTPDDAAQFAGGLRLVPPTTDALALTRH